ncbi:Flp pilus assembly protein CpaB [Paenalcaligenes niemegkensis]|uniref:Flp pilus assembly protein CpaB n=1 Tax=Paenalcaligenes niemegkensis TaxID=2895469 RepID=UPI001EE87BEA|nr:Flp pilus assembly protein CpaB [Paenalcaligenes niemegkensis]MCQ9616205.1 Flp pilus assembly protein CpaB [Paenalcaligenes niemegkensis]
MKKLLNAMTSKQGLLVSISLFCALMAAWSGSRYLKAKAQELEDQASVTQVQRVVAAHDLSSGTVIEAEDLALRHFPAGSVSSDSVEGNNYLKLEGQMLNHALSAGDLILPAHLSAVPYEAFSGLLREGRRAITIPADALSSVAGLVRAGDTIDVYVSFDYQRRRITAPILQRVKVLAVDQAVDLYDSEGASSVSTLTLEVSPEDGVALLAARQAGTITAMLRHPGDEQLSDAAMRGDLAALLGIAQAPVTRRPASAPIIYGNQQTRRVPGLNPTEAVARYPRALFSLPQNAYGLDGAYMDSGALNDSHTPLYDEAGVGPDNLDTGVYPHAEP